MSASGAFGGGIFNGGTLTISDSTISGNSADLGGGIGNRGVLTVSDSTISGNSARVGGGVYSDTDLSSIKTTITNSTISGNSATQRGGGVSNNDGLSVIEHSTITNNTAPNGSGSGVASFGDRDTRTEVLSTIISANQGTDVDFVGGTTNSFVSKGYNLIGSGNATAGFDQTGDQTEHGRSQTRYPRRKRSFHQDPPSAGNQPCHRRHSARDQRLRHHLRNRPARGEPSAGEPLRHRLLRADHHNREQPRR